MLRSQLTLLDSMFSKLEEIQFNYDTENMMNDHELLLLSEMCSERSWIRLNQEMRNTLILEKKI